MLARNLEVGIGPQCVKTLNQVFYSDGVDCAQVLQPIKVPTFPRIVETLHETQVMADHHWWLAHELRSTGEPVWPEALVEMLVDAGVFEPAA